MRGERGRGGGEEEQGRRGCKTVKSMSLQHGAAAPQKQQRLQNMAVPRTPSVASFSTSNNNAAPRQALQQRQQSTGAAHTAAQGNAHKKDGRRHQPTAKWMGTLAQGTQWGH